MDKKVFVFKDIEEISDFVISQWQDLSQEAIKGSGRFTVALSGGSTPIPIYKKLSQHKGLISWDKTHVFMADERFVEWRDPYSNFGAIKRIFLSKIDIPQDNIHPVTIEDTAIDSTKKYQQDLKSFFGIDNDDLPEFDLIMLGMGADGHTASLFPGASVIDEGIVATVQHNRVKHERTSLSLNAINNAKNIIFVLVGEHKAEIVKEILENHESTLPAALVAPDQGKLLFVLDEKAASLLENK